MFGGGVAVVLALRVKSSLALKGSFLIHKELGASEQKRSGNGICNWPLKRYTTLSK